MKPTFWRDAVRESELDGTAKLIALLLSSYMNGAGDTFVGKETLAKNARLKSVRAVDYAIARLEAAGWLEVRRSIGGRSRPNHYLAKTPHGVAGYRDAKPRTWKSKTPHGDAPESVRAESEDLYTRARARGKKTRALRALPNIDLTAYDR